MSSVSQDRRLARRSSSEDALADEWHGLLRRYHHTTCALDRALSADHGITVSDFEVLQQLHNADCAVRMHQLAAEVHLTQSALSRLITRLETAGLVSRGVCSDDRRAAWMQITPAGEALYAAARPTHRAILREMAADR